VEQECQDANQDAGSDQDRHFPSFGREEFLDQPAHVISIVKWETVTGKTVIGNR